MQEVWKDIKDYEGIYQISNFGRIKSLARKRIITYTTKEKILKPIKRRDGYLGFNLRGKNISQHRILAQYFIPNKKDLPFVNHIDGNKANNNLKNLEWCTVSQNVLHAYYILGHKAEAQKGKFGKNHHVSKKIIQKSLRGKIIKIWDSGMDAVRAGFESSCISRCCYGKYKKHKGYIWEFAK